MIPTSQIVSHQNFAGFHANEIHVWTIAINDAVAPSNAFWQVLSKSERIKAEEFVFRKDRNLYVVAHGALRILLSGYTQLAPERIAIGTHAKGKPFVENAKIQFNLSHTSGLVACCFAKEVEVGVDIENSDRKGEWMEIAHHYFSPVELAEINALPDAEKINGFFRCWTRKEACLKATGSGLSVALNAFDVPVQKEATSHSLKNIAGRGEEDVWTLNGLCVPEGYEAAVVHFGTPRPIRVIEFDINRIVPPYLL